MIRLNNNPPHQVSDPNLWKLWMPLYMAKKQSENRDFEVGRWYWIPGVALNTITPGYLQERWKRRLARHRGVIRSWPWIICWCSHRARDAEGIRSQKRRDILFPRTCFCFLLCNADHGTYCLWGYKKIFYFVCHVCGSSLQYPQERIQYTRLKGKGKQRCSANSIPVAISEFPWVQLLILP